MGEVANWLKRQLPTDLRTRRSRTTKLDMASLETDFGKSLEELTGLVEGDPSEAPTPLVEWIRRSWKKPLTSLSDEDIGRLIVQRYGFPYVLDLVWPKLRTDPLFEGGHYPGDVLSCLIRSDESVWKDRPEFHAELKTLYETAMRRPMNDKEAFIESLSIPSDQSQPS